METGTWRETRGQHRTDSLTSLQEAGTEHKIGSAASLLGRGLMASEDEMLSWIHGQGGSASARALRLWMAGHGITPCTERTVGKEATHYVAP